MLWHIDRVLAALSERSIGARAWYCRSSEAGWPLMPVTEFRASLPSRSRALDRRARACGASGGGNLAGDGVAASPRRHNIPAAAEINNAFRRLARLVQPRSIRSAPCQCLFKGPCCARRAAMLLKHPYISFCACGQRVPTQATATQPVSHTASMWSNARPHGVCHGPQASTVSSKRPRGPRSSRARRAAFLIFCIAANTDHRRHIDGPASSPLVTSPLSYLLEIVAGAYSSWAPVHTARLAGSGLAARNGRPAPLGYSQRNSGVRGVLAGAMPVASHSRGLSF